MKNTAKVRNYWTLFFRNYDNIWNESKYCGGAGYRSRYLSHARRAFYLLSYAPDWNNGLKSLYLFDKFQVYSIHEYYMCKLYFFFHFKYLSGWLKMNYSRIRHVFSGRRYIYCLKNFNGELYIYQPTWCSPDQMPT